MVPTIKGACFQGMDFLDGGEILVLISEAVGVIGIKLSKKEVGSFLKFISFKGYMLQLAQRVSNETII
jgi:hypothetical protein